MSNKFEYYEKERKFQQTAEYRWNFEHMEPLERLETSDNAELIAAVYAIASELRLIRSLLEQQNRT